MSMRYEDSYSDPQKKVYAWYSPSLSSVLFWLLAFGAFVFLIWIVSTQNTTNHHVHSVMSKVESIRESPNGGKIVSVSSIVDGGGGGNDDEVNKLPRTIRMCAKEIYYTRYGEWNDTLIKLDLPIEDILTQPLVNSYFHQISVTLDIEFNTNVVNSDDSPTPKALLELNPTMKFMLFSYNITTNYPFFSTINLMELEFDAFEQTIRPPRSIVMCSNSNDIATRRCDHRGDEKIITIHNKNLRPLTTVRTQRKPVTVKPLDSSPQTKQPIVNNGGGGGGTDDEMYDMIGTTDTTVSHIDSQKSEISGQRIYNVVFYKRNQDKQFISHNPNNRNSNSNMREDKVLTLELKHC